MANSTPMVLLLSAWKSFFVKRRRRLDLPTPESPIRTTNQLILTSISLRTFKKIIVFLLLRHYVE